MIAKRLPIAERLFSRIKKDEVTGCWNWTGGKTGGGYGAIGVNNRTELAHRVSYEWHFGQIADGLFVCHRCDNRACINPDHMFLGTQEQNMSDKTAKQRQAKGEGHGCAKLTEGDVLSIRSSHGVTLKDLGKRYGVSWQHIWQIRSGRAWSHLGKVNA